MSTYVRSSMVTGENEKKLITFAPASEIESAKRTPTP